MSIVHDAKEALEKVLDDVFPKINEEGPEKAANKRGQALALFAEAVIQIHKTIAAFGGCEVCYGKGYSTVMQGDVRKMKFCGCARGIQLEGEVASR